jgi:hypothetical protein
MKTIQMFFDILIKYQQLKIELKCRYETHKMNCRIVYDKHLEEQKHDESIGCCLSQSGAKII